MGFFRRIWPQDRGFLQHNVGKSHTDNIRIHIYTVNNIINYFLHHKICNVQSNMPQNEVICPFALISDGQIADYLVNFYNNHLAI